LSQSKFKIDPLLQQAYCISGSSESVHMMLPQSVSLALREWPDVNSSLSLDGMQLLRHAEHNLGVAMATPKGLVVSLSVQV
jgi:pyruvate/2-oxoglutarate dehydrogenase complex dihydrolipoamide acyltransferase (E2) component